MRKLWTKRRSGAGAPPGTLIADPAASPTRIRFVGFGPEELVEETIDDPMAIPSLLERHRIVWVDVTGLRDLEKIRALGEIFGLHPLSLEDVLNVPQRPKHEEYGDHHFIILRQPRAVMPLESEQVSLFLGRGFLLTFQEREGDCLDAVRERLRKGTRIRSEGPEYLAYAVIDAIVDGYFPLLDRYGEVLEELEDRILEGSERSALPRLHDVKRDLLALRRIVWPLREMMAALLRADPPIFPPDVRVYLRDCYDHAVQLMDITETYRDLGASLMELYLSTASNRLNEVMKVLTVIATIFIPLTFIAGVYGMNFDPDVSPWNMPELRWRFGYPLSLALMAVVALLLVIYFKRKDWL
ncbi:MAG: magnesium/cobalt transporter CorA [Candidatus Eisenbacteria bacterium]|nr:magnesium/cobalt transporter CorA [Candidatus Latescibacterota bacterium]MBD3303040.1 magnesium/cobalt transporter CorA [Candidatus Eisenbacteria bacterium]